MGAPFAISKACRTQAEERKITMEKIIVDFEDRDPKSNSIRWNSNDSKGPLQSIYVKKPHFVGARKIRVTIEEVEG